RRILVQQALGHRAVERPDREPDGVLGLGARGGNGGAGGLHGGAEIAAGGAVALAALLVLLHPLDRGFGVGHRHLPPVVHRIVHRIVHRVGDRRERDTRRYRRGQGLSRSLSAWATE